MAGVLQKLEQTGTAIRTLLKDRRQLKDDLAVKTRLLDEEVAKTKELEAKIAEHEALERELNGKLDNVLKELSLARTSSFSECSEESDEKPRQMVSFDTPYVSGVGNVGVEDGKYVAIEGGRLIIREEASAGKMDGEVYVPYKVKRGKGGWGVEYEDGSMLACVPIRDVEVLSATELGREGGSVLGIDKDVWEKALEGIGKVEREGAGKVWIGVQSTQGGVGVAYLLVREEGENVEIVVHALVGG